MAKRRTYEQKLLDDLTAIPARTWFKCPAPPDYDKFVKTVKLFIDCREPFEFSNDYKKIRRLSDEWIPPELWHKMKELPPGITVQKIDRGDQEEITLKNGSTYLHTFEQPFYRIWKNGINIATET